MIPFFENIDELKEFVPGIDSKENIKNFGPYAITAEKEIVKIIGRPLWDDLLTKHKNRESLAEIRNLRGAMASFMAIGHTLYDTIHRNNTERKVYKYQYNEIVAQLTERAHFYMSELLQKIKDNDLFKNTDTAREQEKLIVKNYKHFGRIYGIDDSAYFFHISVFLQKEAIRNHIQGRKLDLENAKIKEFAEIAVVYHTMALAVERLDAMVLPKIIRRDLQLNSELIKRGESNEESKKNLVRSLKNEGDRALLNLDAETQKSNKTTTDVEDLSDPSDKFFMPC